jgi:hypothetical protein
VTVELPDANRAAIQRESRHLRPATAQVSPRAWRGESQSHRIRAAPCPQNSPGAPGSSVPYEGSQFG